MTTHELISAEIKIINQFLQINKIRARAVPSLTSCIEVGYFEYGLEIAPTEKISKIEAVQRELRIALVSHRKRLGIVGEMTLFPVFTPRLALQVTHPWPKFLPSETVFSLKPNIALVGKSYSGGPKFEFLDFNTTPHALIVGTTGAGKSMLLAHLLITLMHNTSPAEIQIMLVDLKHEDLVPFKTLPHVVGFAGTVPDAVELIGMVNVERDKRVEKYGYKPYRILLVVDEMADLPPQAVSMLERISTIGRSKLINLVGATQSPTEKGGFGSLLKSNFSVRLVGKVAPGQSHIASNRPGTFAEYLPRGSFLWIEGSRQERFQGFFFPEEEVLKAVKRLKMYWHRKGFGSGYMADIGGYKADMEADIGGYKADMEAEKADISAGYGNRTLAEQIEGYADEIFPIIPPRKLRRREVLILKELATLEPYRSQGLPSLRRLTVKVFGSRNPQRTAWVREALSA